MHLFHKTSLRHQMPGYFCILLGLSFVSPKLPAQEWAISEEPNPHGPGRVVMIRQANQAVASFVFGEGQMKPFLHIHGTDGVLLTNPGLNQVGKTTGQFPHHRGIFIGWKIESDLGKWDLWHMNRGESIDVAGFDEKETGADHAKVTARAVWRAGKKDSQGNDKLLEEVRRMKISKPAARATQVDIEFILQAARDVRLAGDLQHSGVHFRAANAVAENSSKSRTRYWQDPAGVVKGENLKWCQLSFPLGERWYAVQEMNAPANPVQELSMRNYGRFGYFFQRSLKKGETLRLQYRFVIEETGPPDADQEIRWKTQAAQRYQDFLESIH